MRSMDFTIVLRGYEKREVDGVLDRARKALAGFDETQRVAARTELQNTSFTVALRGYDRDQVHKAVEKLLRRFGAAPSDLRAELASMLNLAEPTDEEIIGAVQRLLTR